MSKVLSLLVAVALFGTTAAFAAEEAAAPAEATKANPCENLKDKAKADCEAKQKEEKK